MYFHVKAMRSSTQDKGIRHKRMNKYSLYPSQHDLSLILYTLLLKIKQLLSFNKCILYNEVGTLLMFDSTLTSVITGQMHGSVARTRIGYSSMPKKPLG